MNKKILVLSLALTIMLMGGLVLNIPVVILATVGAACISILFLDLNNATNLLFYLSPLSYIFVFGQYNIYILLIVAYIMAVLLKRKNVIGIITSFFLFAYCFIFASSEVSLNIGRFIHPLLLMVLIFVCQFTERKDYKSNVLFFLTGFIVSAFIGFFKSSIPMLQDVLILDALYIDGVETSMNIMRFSGISYDPNFFTLIDCILIAILLFGEKKMGFIKIAALIFLVVVGFFTFSKSYVLLLTLIGIVYIFKNNKKPLMTIFLILAAFICIILAEKYTNIRLLSLIEARFSGVNGTNDLTTGRLDLWVEYIDYILNNLWCLLFGEGFNALSLGKAVHNTYIDWIYRFGIIGTALWFGYFKTCKSNVDKTGIKKTSVNMAGMVFLLGIFFLSAFHFEQLWCCIYMAMIAPYTDGGSYEEIKCDSTDI